MRFYKLKIKFKNEDHKRIFDNIIALFGLQSLNYILPIITFPYLTRVLGPDNFGLIAFSSAFIGYFQIFTDYGFNLSATRQISMNRNDNEKLSNIFSEVFSAKLLLMLISFVVLLIIIFTFSKFSNNKFLYLFTFGLVIGSCLFPTWLFQGIEKMRYITILNVLTGVIFTLSIFIFVKESTNYIYVPLINAISSILIGLISLYIIKNKFNIKYRKPSYNDIIAQYKEGWHVFISSFATSFYVVSNTFILGFFASNTIVGYYSVAEKAIRVIVSIFSPIFQAVYPHICLLITESKKNGITFINKIAKFTLITSLIFSFLVLIFANLIIYILAGGYFIESVLILRIFSFLPLIIPMGYIFGVLTLLTLNFKEMYSKIYIIASILNIIVIFSLTPFYKEIGAAISLLVSESFVTIAMYLYLRHKGIKIPNFSIGQKQ